MSLALTSRICEYTVPRAVNVVSSWYSAFSIRFCSFPGISDLRRVDAYDNTDSPIATENANKTFSQ